MLFRSVYMKFCAIGIRLSKAFQDYVDNLDVIFQQSEKVMDVYNNACDKLGDYQAKMSIVKKEETEQNLKAEKQSLMIFVKEFERFNQESNVFRIALATLFDGAAVKLSLDACEAAEFCQYLVLYPTIVNPTNEAVELDDYVLSLMKDRKSVV